jgi:hypothetical protein
MKNNWISSQSAHSLILLVFVCVCFCIGVWAVGDDWIHEQILRVTGCTADAETGPLLVIKRCLCPMTFCSYKCLNISLFLNSGVFYSFICYELTIYLQSDGGLSIHATLSFSIWYVIWNKVTWFPANLTALYYKTANCSVTSTEWSHLWYSASSCYVLRKYVKMTCAI